MPFGILEDPKIPYGDQASKIFNLDAARDRDNGIQRVVPFLGAGVSISARSHSPLPAAQLPDTDKLEQVFQLLGLEKRARTFAELAILTAYLMQAAEQAGVSASPTADKLRAELREGDYPPSAGELAHLFSLLSSYTTFERVVERVRGNFGEYPFGATGEEQIESLKLLAKVTGVANPPEVLTGITSYYESISGRGGLWNSLSSVIARKKKPTPTHKLLAAAAKYHLAQKYTLDYLIITTNYDCLMEQALDDLGVPYVVLLTRKADQKVVVRFSENIPNADDLKRHHMGPNNGHYAHNFVLQMFGEPRYLVVIYKIHGCLSEKLQREEADGVVISDTDYVQYIKQMGQGNGLIPAHVNNLMHGKEFLFMGYSLNDWNVRSIFETVREKRNLSSDGQDYSVMRDVTPFEEVFFRRNDVMIFQTDLSHFAGRVVGGLPPDVREGLGL